jgi:nucleoside-diphosphate-sugar epimerase
MAKLCAGQMTRVLCGKLGMRHNWGRILSVYGPCDNQNSVIMYAIRSCREGIRPEFTAGEQQWDYLYSADAGDALYGIGAHGKDKRVYPIGSGMTRSLRAFLEEACRQADSAAEPVFGARPYPDGQVMHLCADIRELCEDTGFSPRISFEEGIRRTIEWYKEECKRDV